MQIRICIVFIAMTLLAFAAASGSSFTRQKIESVGFDNDLNLPLEGLTCLQDQSGKIGNADTQGHEVIVPKFAFVFPFNHDQAKGTEQGNEEIVQKSDGEIHARKNNHLFCIEKTSRSVNARLTKLLATVM